MLLSNFSTCKCILSNFLVCACTFIFVNGIFVNGISERIYMSGAIIQMHFDPTIYILHTSKIKRPKMLSKLQGMYKI